MKNALLKKVVIILVMVISASIIMYFFSNNNPDTSGESKKEYEKKITRPYFEIEKSNGIVTNIWFRDEKILDNLVKHNMKYLFVDVGDINKDGRLMTFEVELQKFISFINNYEEKNKFDFILLPYNEVIVGKYDFSSEKFRNNLIKNYIEMIQVGFDGAYIDVEAIPMEQRETFLLFLEDIGKEIGKNKTLAAYAGALNDDPNEWEWEPNFYEAVSDRIDIILIQSYDFGLNNKEKYQNYLTEQINFISELELNANLFATLPTHKSYPETLENAIEIYSQKKDIFVGSVIFAEWKTSDEEWKIFEKYS